MYNCCVSFHVASLCVQIINISACVTVVCISCCNHICKKCREDQNRIIYDTQWIDAHDYTIVNEYVPIVKINSRKCCASLISVYTVWRTGINMVIICLAKAKCSLSKTCILPTEICTQLSEWFKPIIQLTFLLKPAHPPYFNPFSHLFISSIA